MVNFGEHRQQTDTFDIHEMSLSNLKCLICILIAHFCIQYIQFMLSYCKSCCEISPEKMVSLGALAAADSKWLKIHFHPSVSDECTAAHTQCIMKKKRKKDGQRNVKCEEVPIKIGWNEDEAYWTEKREEEETKMPWIALIASMCVFKLFLCISLAIEKSYCKWKWIDNLNR